MGLEFFQANKNSFFSCFFKRSIFLFLKNFKLLRFYPQRRKAVQWDINTCFADIRKADKCFSGAMRRHQYPLYWICWDIDICEAGICRDKVLCTAPPGFHPPHRCAEDEIQAVRRTKSCRRMFDKVDSRRCGSTSAWMLDKVDSRRVSRSASWVSSQFGAKDVEHRS
jgi:hypothetical protein